LPGWPAKTRVKTEARGHGLISGIDNPNLLVQAIIANLKSHLQLELEGVPLQCRRGCMQTQIDVRWPSIVQSEQEVSGKAMGRQAKD
jgi:hypothetical protein